MEELLDQDSENKQENNKEENEKNKKEDEKDQNERRRKQNQSIFYIRTRQLQIVCYRCFC